MTPDRDDGGRSPRREKSESAFRLEKAKRESIEPERRSVPSWKRTAAKLNKEQAAPAGPRDDAGTLPQADNPAPSVPVDGGEQEQRDTEPEAPRQDASGQSVPKYRQHSRREQIEASPANQKFRQNSSQPPPAEKLHRGAAGAAADQPEPDKLRKARRRMEQREGNEHRKGQAGRAEIL